MKYFSLFTGVGGFEQAMPKDFECIGMSEIDHYASDVLRYHYPNIKNYGDIKNIEWDGVPDFDLLVGGSPCQDLSVAGTKKGLTGERSGLFTEYVRALKEKKPSYFIWENVKGALSSNGGRDFATIFTSFSEAGYSLWWQVLNAKDFGVPQNRERVFVVGARNGSPREVFFKRETNNVVNDSFNEEKRAYAPTLRANHHNTLDVHFILKKDGSIRRLIPKECERLMSWPDDWTRYGKKEDGTVYEISDSQRYKMCGNGVVSKVVSEIVKYHLL